MRHFTEEQQMFRSAYRKFLEAEIAPNIEKWREQNIVDREAFKKAGDQGFLMIWPDEQYGGTGDNDFRFEQIIIEETVRQGCGEWFNSLHSRLVGPYINNFGTDAQKQRFLPSCVSGEKILAIAMTEPDAGSDLAGMRTTLIEQGDHFVLNGSKTYISNGINADYIVVAGKSDAANNPHAMTLCIVERGMEGFERGRKLNKMGLKAQDTAELFFSQVKIPKQNILGEPGQGFFYLMHGLAEERLLAAVGSIANARRAFDLTRDFAMTRKVFGKPLAEKQNTRFKLAEMDTEISILEMFVDQLVLRHNAGDLSINLAAKAKLQSTEVEWRMLDLGVQLHGGAGYMQDYPICNMFTDARANRIFAGSSEIMKLIIGRDIFSDQYRSNLN
ncbi:acyl-CoA dehydrogenase family protein [Simiduia curdlanivorans]|uniref:Acyl-CoA dehydrogenase family protein n=1 Tax=Simiduia curdlanivorans TaxID=1492769 RepID=A0ABV8V8L3_9GAMM|nr:acyl-CoA dehydrogenase family protein [Simiduia curdlanivorans]MDN3638820.1 acyl-CoA dehydrogenase family protein [Simiduia curdlanivorans]